MFPPPAADESCVERKKHATRIAAKRIELIADLP
jgi:hypothetical protein